MLYPQTISLSPLESKHPEYNRYDSALREIDLLTSGGYKLKSVVKEFLPARPGEDPVTYRSRINKFTYLNILGSAINDQVAKVSNGSLVVSGLSDNPLWNEFRTNTDLANRHEKSLLSQVLREALKFKKVYIHLDKPKSLVEPLNRAQEQLLGLRPYTVLYSPFQVINWSETSGKLNWIKVRQVVEESINPLLPPVTKVIWTIIDNEHITKYEATVKLNSQGEIEQINDEFINDETQVTQISSVAHGYGEVPVVKVEIPEELWVADQAALKALEHLRIDCAKYDLLTMAYFQRTYKKINLPDDDFEVSHIDSADQPLPTGLQHVLELEKFDWSEPHGYILPHLMDSLSQIEDQVKDLVSQGGFSSNKGAIAQSGESKQMDFYKEESILRAHGELLIKAYEQLLHLVARALGENLDISVTGFSNFENNSLDGDIKKLDQLSKINFEALKLNLPNEAYKVMYSSLISKYVGNINPEQQEVINNQIDSMLLS
ncbi:hypothetical protein [Picosynechococcus sp. PCC 7117]|uniref:hypothetical protein n=1 Tax=Picosynechococcus sp. PCC 7117 TaxID=195498 RepID=UPI000810F18A|nr:hypothetical protein [Picosynechococcus sp. PCC 7117]ANV88486.1 hypothetical protein AWQ22_14020 [Picosynechococcus sp. PCC 7117]